ncbi:MAG: histidine kinase [Bacteroidales bacterium]|nr:histidine kinase [Bacteroidales bacterium]
MKERSLKINREKIFHVLFDRLQIIWHVLYWSAAYLILLKIFSFSERIEKIDALYTLVFIFPILICTYLNLYVLIPFLLKKTRYLWYAAAFILLAFGSAGMIHMLFERWIDYILKGYYFISYDEYSVLLIYAFVFLALSTLLKLAKEWAVYTRREKHKRMVQLRNLQAQINPHFLMNSLQTIYSLSLNKSEKTPETILQLSEILKFSIYETSQDRVSLKREIEVMKDYVEIYRLRVDPDRAQISFDVEGMTDDLVILPLLFLPFLENSFKHGIQGTEKRSFVEIRFQIRKNNLNFRITNNCGHPDKIENEAYSGIGIENTKKRLAISYPGKHQLDIRKNDDTFEVSMDIILERK